MAHRIHTLENHRLESGAVLRDVPVAYQTWGSLNPARDNAVLVCHALTGNADVESWWGGLLGPGLALDTDRYFVLCSNVLGSCYGTAGPTSVDPATGAPYGPGFPRFTIRDVVGLQKRLLDALDVRGAAFAIGGSMGGMQALEWAFYGSFVRSLVPIAVGPHHSAWCIGWSEAQRQAIFNDPLWQDGHYAPDRPPAAGLATARMIAMISYRNQLSFEARFGREMQAPPNGRAPLFSVESYLHYQGRKLVDRFDAHTYVGLTRAMDSHDVARGRGREDEVLAGIRQPTLVIGITSDVLYPLHEQRAMARQMPRAEVAVVESDQGHDAFLIEFDQLNHLIRNWTETHERILAGS